ncbi:MAG: hypothetical protein MJ187_00545 [Alphaproteobacteria bacterium]|nr:hypothetical protein [Alphaproteobacteria bacterium]
MPRFDVVIHGNPYGHAVFINEKDNVVKNTIDKSFFMSFYNHVIKKKNFTMMKLETINTFIHL